ncbi:MAG: biotin/lipoyl-containing protein, partial [Candidatus Krumholzibacteriota bacterium]
MSTPSRKPLISDREAASLFEFKLPDLGEGIAEGEILKWYVAEGGEIGEDEPLMDVETDKA